jgi:tRNA modification GTPase
MRIISPTIAAIATGPAPGGIGILRISGALSLVAARRVVPSLPVEMPPRTALVRPLTDGEGVVLDEGVVLFFPGPHSYTGEDVVELQGHGSPRLLALLLKTVLATPGLRPAEPGEFTRRAFLNGRIDLARAEAVQALIGAESEVAVRAAAAQLHGELSRRLEALRAALVDVQADVEGVLDFPDEAEGADETVAPRLAQVEAQVRELVEAARRGSLLRRGARVALYGPVNAGKSTLFNRLVGAARALVDAEPGTTRDLLEARLELSGLTVTLLDTAGLREAAGRVEGLGIARAREALAAVDLAVLVTPPDCDAQQLAAWRAEVPGERRLDVRGKADMGDPAPVPLLAVSGVSGQGVDALRHALRERLLPSQGDAAALVTERHQSLLEHAAAALERAVVASQHSTLEVVAGELALAIDALAQVTGSDASSELLDAIFQRFCIGK